MYKMAFQKRQFLHVFLKSREMHYSFILSTSEVA